MEEQVGDAKESRCGNLPLGSLQGELLDDERYIGDALLRLPPCPLQSENLLLLVFALALFLQL